VIERSAYLVRCLVVTVGSWDGWIPAEDLLAYAADAGYDVTRTQLVRWHKAGLIARPDTRYRSGRRGAETVYPPGTAEILLDVCTLQFPRQPLEVTRWRLWWMGHDQDMGDIRHFLLQTCEGFDNRFATLRKMVSTNGRVPSSKWTVRGFLNESPDLQRPLGTIRRRLNWRGRREFSQFADLMIRVLTGEYEASSEDGELFSKAIGFDKARRTTLNGSTEWMGPPDAGALVWMSRFMSETLASRLDRMTDEELVAARDRTIFFFGSIVSFGEVMRWTFGTWGLGFGFAAMAVERLLRDPEHQAFLLLLFHAFSADPQMADGLKTMQPTLDTWNREGYQSWRRLRFLASEVPALENALRPKYFAAALRSKSGADAHLARIRAVRAGHASEIDAVIAANPEVFPLDEIEAAKQSKS
jgi:hypothetical protein